MIVLKASRAETREGSVGPNKSKKKKKGFLLNLNH